MKIKAAPMWQDIILEANPDLIGDSLSILLAQSPSSSAVWKVRVYVHVSQAKMLLGSFTTAAISATQLAARVIGFANCPGATGWSISVFSTTTGDEADFYLSSSKCCAGGAAFGVVVNNTFN